MATSCLGAADSEAELELEFSYGEVSVANSLPALNEEIIDGKTDINPDETGTGSFHSSLNISQGISTSADAGPSACLTPVHLQLLPPLTNAFNTNFNFCLQAAGVPRILQR